MNHLHSDYSIDEEQHGYQECHVGKSLVWEKEKHVEIFMHCISIHLPNHQFAIPGYNMRCDFYCHFQLLSTQTVSNGCQSLTWKDLMKVHRRVLIPSPLLRSLTSLITLNKRKKVIEMRALSSVFWGKECKKWGEEEKSEQCSFQVSAGMKLSAVFIYYSCNRWRMHLVSTEIGCQSESVLLWISFPTDDVCTIMQQHTETRMQTMAQRDLQTLNTYYSCAVGSWFLKSATFRRQTNLKIIAKLPSLDDTNINAGSGFVMQILLTQTRQLFIVQPCWNCEKIHQGPFLWPLSCTQTSQDL